MIVKLVVDEVVRTGLDSWHAENNPGGLRRSSYRRVRQESDAPDGRRYTLNGVVTAQDGAPLRDVSVLIGREGSSEFHSFAMTGADGAFLFKPAPATGPSTEIFRFEKSGFAAREVFARTATRLEAYRYRLEVELDPEPAP